MIDEQSSASGHDYASGRSAIGARFSEVVVLGDLSLDYMGEVSKNAKCSSFKTILQF